MDLSGLNKVGKIADFKETIKVINLKKNTPYKILNVKIIPTKYCESVLCELDDWCVWLPNRYTNWFAEEGHIQNFSTGEYYMKVVAEKVIYGNITPIIEFQKGV